ncbi:MAG: RHS repeat-associated core domain-containing protein [Pseudomonadota bacterium]
MAKPTNQESLGYTGQRRDSSTDLLYLHARYYDPALGRFISPDPITPGKEIVKLNHYAYSDDDPINKTDVTGMQAMSSDATGTASQSDILRKKLNLHGTFENPYVMNGVTVSAKAPTSRKDVAEARFELIKQDPKLQDQMMSLVAGATGSLPSVKRLVTELITAGSKDAFRVGVAIGRGEVKVNLLGKEMFAKAADENGLFGNVERVAGFQKNGQLYLRNTGDDVMLSTAVHEGDHALRRFDKLGGHEFENSAYKAEMKFQRSINAQPDFTSVRKIKEFVRGEYRDY